MIRLIYNNSYFVAAFSHIIVQAFSKVKRHFMAFFIKIN